MAFYTLCDRFVETKELIQRLSHELEEKKIAFCREKNGRCFFERGGWYLYNYANLKTSFKALSSLSESDLEFSKLFESEFRDDNLTLVTLERENASLKEKLLPLFRRSKYLAWAAGYRVKYEAIDSFVETFHLHDSLPQVLYEYKVTKKPEYQTEFLRLLVPALKKEIDECVYGQEMKNYHKYSENYEYNPWKKCFYHVSVDSGQLFRSPIKDPDDEEYDRKLRDARSLQEFLDPMVEVYNLCTEELYRSDMCANE